MNSKFSDPDIARANPGLHEHVIATISRLGMESDVSVLDVGCGTGFMLRRLAESGHRWLVGIDIDPPTDTENIRYLKADLDAPHFPLADSSLDLVLLVEVIEHVQNPGLLLAEISRVLAPAGVLLITTPNVHSLEARLRWLLLGRLKQFDEIGDPTHIYPVFRHPFLKILARSRLEVIRSWGFPEDGSSPTSRSLLRMCVRLLRLIGLKADIGGDQWCLLARRASPDTDTVSKEKLITQHYLKADSQDASAAADMC